MNLHLRAATFYFVFFPTFRGSGAFVGNTAVETERKETCNWTVAPFIIFSTKPFDRSLEKYQLFGLDEVTASFGPWSTVACISHYGPHLSFFFSPLSLRVWAALCPCWWRMPLNPRWCRRSRWDGDGFCLKDKLVLQPPVTLEVGLLSRRKWLELCREL